MQQTGIAMQIVGPDHIPVTIASRTHFGRGDCGVTEPRCSRRQFAVERLQSGGLLLINLSSNREMAAPRIFTVLQLANCQ